MLDATRSSIARLPIDMRALSAVTVTGCSALAADWLPESSTVELRNVKADASILQCLPEGLKAKRIDGNPICIRTDQLARCASLTNNGRPAIDSPSYARLPIYL